MSFNLLDKSIQILYVSNRGPMQGFLRFVGPLSFSQPTSNIFHTTFPMVTLKGSMGEDLYSRALPVRPSSSLSVCVVSVSSFYRVIK